MNLISALLNGFSPVEPNWCCDRCRLAAEAAAAEKSLRSEARAISAFSRNPTSPPLSSSPQPDSQVA